MDENCFSKQKLPKQKLLFQFNKIVILGYKIKERKIERTVYFNKTLIKIKFIFILTYKNF